MGNESCLKEAFLTNRKCKNNKNKTMKKSLLTLALCLVSLLATAQHFITDAAYRAKVDAAFQAKMKLIGEKFYRLDGLHATPQEQ